MIHSSTLLTSLLLRSFAALPAAESSIGLAENGVARHGIVVDSARTATEAERFAAEKLALGIAKPSALTKESLDGKAWQVKMGSRDNLPLTRA